MNHQNRSHRIWRSLEELEGDESFQEVLHREFPAGASIWDELDNPISRRSFLQLLGASAALAGITACTKMPAEKIIPYVVNPETIIPGIPATYASSMTLAGYAKGLFVQSHEGRPTKIEGNPLHPASLGTSDLFMQAELLQMYDPDRSKDVTHLGSISTWDHFHVSIMEESSKWKANGGEGVRILTETVTSPSLTADLDAFLKKYPKAQWHVYEPIHLDLTRKAATQCFGQDLNPIYDYAQADVVFSLDADFFGPGPAQQANAKAFMSRRQSPDKFNRLYVAESTLSLTGARADHRLAVRPSQTYSIALALAHELGVQGVSQTSALDATQSKWIREAAKDLKSHSGRSIVIAGSYLPVETQAIIFAINEKLQNIGKTLTFISHVETGTTSHIDSLSSLVKDMRDGKVSALFVLGANPVYQSPGSLPFLENYKKVPLRVHLGHYQDETSYYSHWHLPQSHFLETWGTSRAFDGALSLQQPLISPLYDTRSVSEVFSILLSDPGRTAFEALQGYWNSHQKGASFESCIQDGILAHSEAKTQSPRLKGDWAKGLPSVSSQNQTNEIEAIIRPDSTLWDGRYANNGWLQELPKPLLQLTWDNAVLMSPDTASRYQLKDEDEVEITYEGRKIRGAVLRIPGHPDQTVTLTLGYGRTHSGRVGNGKGYNAYTLQNHLSPYWIPSIQWKKTGKRHLLATIHTQYSMEGRDIVVRTDLKKLQTDGNKIVPEKSRTIDHPSLIGTIKGSENAWAMVINLTTCIGCKACTIACQAENNIPIVGKDQVRNGRAMHWIRVDRYFEGSARSPSIYFQPVPCMHCEKAPCEYVCPTGATVHSSDGLNEMVYNRCVGTRYCSNNCPYKVRRFNFFQYADVKSKSLQLMYNPDVTVRSRGVMEKCTYCVQRIQEVRIQAEKENRPIRDGEIVTACAQACPTDAIVFGDKNDHNSRVARLRESPQHYFLLAELGTQPRTTYLASIKNPNPSLNEES